ncbi:MAG TPA: GNAT family N-acetyltransferase [Jatrophihabitans sp.]|nr:GNAT family N-acetyltransferase [Jatrophihabitans sp.]
MTSAPPRGAGRTVSLRAASAGDDSWLAELFLHGRPELAALPPQLIALQRQAQRVQYTADFPGYADYLLTADDRMDAGPIGCLSWWRDQQEHRLLDLTVHSAWRGQGIGRQAIQLLARTASSADRPLRLSVWSGNEPALRLYRSCGFQPDGAAGGYLFMRLLPGRER